MISRTGRDWESSRAFNPANIPRDGTHHDEQKRQPLESSSVEIPERVRSFRVVSTGGRLVREEGDVASLEVWLIDVKSSPAVRTRGEAESVRKAMQSIERTASLVLRGREVARRRRGSSLDLLPIELDETVPHVASGKLLQER